MLQNYIIVQHVEPGGGGVVVSNNNNSIKIIDNLRY